MTNSQNIAPDKSNQIEEKRYRRIDVTENPIKQSSSF